MSDYYDSTSPLHIATCKGYIGFVKYLVETKKVDVNQHSTNGETPLHIATRKGYLHVVKLLVETGKANVEKANVRGETPLHIATRKGYLGLVRYLVETKKVDVNLPSTNGETPLHIASRKGYLGLARFLFSVGGRMLRLPKCLQIGSMPAQVKPALGESSLLYRNFLVNVVQLEEARVTILLMEEMKLLPSILVKLIIEYSQNEEWQKIVNRILL